MNSSISQTINRLQHMLVGAHRHVASAFHAIATIAVGTSFFAISLQAYAACVVNAGPKSNPLTYTVPGDGTVIYAGSGLQWSQCLVGVTGASCTGGAPLSVNWANAMTAAATSTLAGYTDWRLPNRQELASIIEDTCASPAFDPAFANMLAGQIWSSTTVTSTDAIAQSSSFGVDFVYPKSNSGIVLLVRGGNGLAGYDTMAPAGVSAAGPASGNVTQGIPFDVVIATSLPLFEAVTFTLGVQPGSRVGVLGGNTGCVIAANQTSCTVTGTTFSGVSGPPLALNVGVSSSANALSFSPVPALNVLPSPQAIALIAPAAAIQFAPFDVGLTLTTAVTSATTFALSKASGPSGALAGNLSCMVPMNGTTCTFSGVTFTGYGNNLELTAAATSGPVIPVSNTTFNVASQPFNLTMSSPTQAVAGAPFDLVMTLSPPAPAAITVNVLKSSGPAGALVGPQQCVVPAGGTSCSIVGISFPNTGTLGLSTSVSSAYVLDLVPPTASVNIVLPTYTITLIAPALVTVGTPFNVSLVSNQVVAFAVPLTLSVASGAGGVLGGNTSCTIAAGQTSCTVAGVTYSAPGSIQLTATTPAEGAFFAYERASIAFAAAAPIHVPVLDSLALLLLIVAAIAVAAVTSHRQVRRTK